MTELNAQFRRNVRVFYAYLGSLLIAGIGPLAALRLVHSASLTGRIAAVVVGVGAWIPMVYMIARIIRMGDEYTRRLHLVALAVSFVGGLLLIALFDWLARAHFMKPVPLMLLWLALALLYIVSIFGAKYYFERET